MITDDVIAKISRLSRLRITPEDVVTYQLDAIISWIDQLQSVTTDDVSLEDAETPMCERDDVVTATNRLTEVLQNAPATQYDMFSVPKVVE